MKRLVLACFFTVLGLSCAAATEPPAEPTETFHCGTCDALVPLTDPAAVPAADPVAASNGGTGGIEYAPIPLPAPAVPIVKRALFMRVDFPDAAGSQSDASMSSLLGFLSTHWLEMSYGKMTWAAEGAGSTVTPVLRLPLGYAKYTDFGTILAAARTAAAAAGYNWADYTHDVVITGAKPDTAFSGVAYLGGRSSWLRTTNGGICSHEFGHNFGLQHAALWNTSDGTVIGPGSSDAAGNDFDHMGGFPLYSSTIMHFGARAKNYLDWIADTDVVKITADGSTTTRIQAFDQGAAIGPVTIAVDRAGTSNDYWIEYRQRFASTKPYLKDGVLLHWGNITIDSGVTTLLDNTPATATIDDGAVLIGRTFSDTAAGIHITPVLRGAEANGVSWVDVTVNRGTFPGNRKPTVAMAATSINPAANGSVNFTATASDPDGDTLGYCWDWGDGTFTANNSATATKSWSATGTKTVRCYVTDMKGMVTTGSMLIQVGTSSTFFVQGTVTTTLGLPIENAVVTADATHTDTTDSEGYYAITGLAAGSYTLTASKAGLGIQPGNFTNPLVVAANKQNINLVSPPGAPYFATMKPGVLDAGSNTGAVILPVFDADTAVTSLTLTGTSSNPAVIPNASITFGTIGTTVRTVTVAALSSGSGPVDITITATDPDGTAASYVYPVTVNSKPVLTGLTGKAAAENSPLEIDLRTLATDALTAGDKLCFEVSRARNGTVDLLADGHTARFTPAPGYNGAASFLVTVRDQSLGTRMLLLYDFEPPDLSNDSKASDLSNFNRIGSLENSAAGGEFSYAADVPAALAPYATQSLNLTQTNTGGSRLQRTLAATDLDYNDADWSFSAWVKRAGSDSDDIIFHLGDGDGFGPNVALQLYFPANSDVLKVATYGAAGLEKETVGPELAAQSWHHVTLTYDRTATKVGTLALYVDGFAYGSVASVAMNVNQASPLVIGGHNSTSLNLAAWFDGNLDEVTMQSGVTGRPEIWGMAHGGTRHYHGLSASGTVGITVSGSNQVPAVAAIPDVVTPVGVVSAPVPILLSDAESEGRTLTVTAATSAPAILPVSGIAISAAPAAWTSGDIGAVGAAGSLIEDHGTFIVSGAGADIGPATGDEFRWVRQDFTGDSEIIARVAGMDFTHTDAKAGLMMRDSATATSPYALVAVTPGSGITFQYRATESTAAVIKGTIPGVAAPCWLRLVRTGNDFTALYAPDLDGVAGIWQPVATAQTIVFSAPIDTVGLAVSSKVDATNCTAVFEQVGGTVLRGGERNLTLTPAAAASGPVVVTLTVSDGSATSTRSFNVLVQGSAPSTSVWSSIATGGLWGNGANWINASVADGSVATADFSTLNILADNTVHLNGPRTLRALDFGDLTASNGWTLDDNGSAANILTLAGAAPAITVGDLGAGKSATVSAVIAGSADWTKTGGGQLTLTGANSFSGALTISKGIVEARDNNSTLGGNAGPTLINSTGSTATGGQLVLAATAGTASSSENIIIQGLGETGGTTAALLGKQGVITFNGGVTLDGTGTYRLASQAMTVPTTDFKLNGNITRSGTNSGALVLQVDGTAANYTTNALMTINGSVDNNGGAVTLKGANLGTLLLNTSGHDIGDFTIDGAYTPGASPLLTTLKLGLSNALPTDRNLTIAKGVFNLAGKNQAIHALHGVLGAVTNSTAATTSVLTIGNGDGGTYGGIIENGSGTVAVVKNGPGTQILAGANTYTGSTTIGAGILRAGIASTANVDGAFGLNSAVILSNIPGATLDINGFDTRIGSLTGGGTAGGDVTLGSKTLTVGGDNSSPAAYAGGVSGSGGSLQKTGTGKLILSGLSATAAGNYTGTTILNTGTLAITTTSPTFTGGLTFGSSAASTTVGTLDLSNASANFGGPLTVQTNSAGLNTILIGSGRTLVTNGNVAIGANTASGMVTNLTVAGAGSWTMSNSATTGTFQLGTATGTVNTCKATLDLSALGTFTANFPGASSYFRIGDPNSTSSGTSSTMILAVNSTITVPRLSLGENSGESGTMRLKLGTGTQVINSNMINIGLINNNGRSSGALTFNGPSGTVKIRGTNGTARAGMNLFASNVSGTGTALANVFDVTGHSADLLFATVDVMNCQSSGTTNYNSTFSFDTGTLDITTLKIGSKGGVGLNTAIGTVNIGSTSNSVNQATLGAVTMATMTGTIGTAAGNLNIKGSATTVGITSLTVAKDTAATGGGATGIVTVSGGTTTVTGGITLAARTSAGTVNGSLFLTGGSLTVGGDITTTGTGGTVNTTLTLNGGSLNMGGHAIGGPGQLITNLSLQTGTLQNVSQINNGAGLKKVTAGTLALAGTNSYTGGTTISAGQMNLTGTVASGVTVTGGIFQGVGTVTGNVAINGGIHAPGASPGIMTVTGNYGLAAAGTLQVEINGTTAGTGYDQLKTTGPVTLAGTLDLIAAPALAAGSNFTLIDNTGTAAVSGTFTGLPQSSEFYEDAQWWRINYSGGTGNDVVLTRITPTPWQNWRAANFGANTNNSAITADLVDTDGDGLVNLLEYGLGGNPNAASASALPKGNTTSGYLALTFTRTLANTDITMTVRGSDSPNGPWTDLARSTAGAAFTPLLGSVTETGTGATRSVQIRDLYLITNPAHPRRFLRLEVVRP